MIRKVMGLIIIFVICFMEVGCMYTKEDYKKVMNDAVQYLTDKYGEEFILDSYEIGDILSDTVLLWCCMPFVTITVLKSKKTCYGKARAHKTVRGNDNHGLGAV